MTEELRDIVDPSLSQRISIDRICFRRFERAHKDEARARLNRAERSVELTRNSLSYATLEADARGVVTATMIEPGVVVAAGQAAIRVARFAGGGDYHILANSLAVNAGTASGAPATDYDGQSRLKEVDIGFEYVAFNNRRPPFDDAAFRRALSLAIDRTLMVSAAWQDFAIPANSHVSPALSYWHDPKVDQMKTGLAEAKQILQQAGYRVVGGKLYYPAGKTETLTTE